MVEQTGRAGGDREIDAIRLRHFRDLFRCPLMQIELHVEIARAQLAKDEALLAGAEKARARLTALVEKGAADYGLKLIEVSRANTNSAFDFATQLFAVKSLAEMVELSTSHMRKQFDTMSAQGKELTALAQKVTTETVEPIKESVSSAFKKVA